MPPCSAASHQRPGAAVLRRSAAQASYKLLECYAGEGKVVIAHPQGHVVPRLEGASFEALQAFLGAQAAAQGARGML